MVKKDELSTFRLLPKKDGRGYQIFLNGQDISKGIMAVAFQLKAGERPKLYLILTGKVEIPDDLPAIVIVDETGE